jgi:UMF1 family MFS transporter
MFYADGIVVIQTGGGLYAVGVLNFTPQELLYLVIVGNAFAGLITYFGGFLIDKYECKKIIMWSIFGIMVGILIIGFAQSKIHFFGAAMLVAGFIGPLQSASRVLMAKIIPAANQGMGFGLYGLSSKATAFLGPVLVGTLTFYISQRVGFVSILILFLISLWMLWKLDLD